MSDHAQNNDVYIVQLVQELNAQNAKIFILLKEAYQFSSLEQQKAILKKFDEINTRLDKIEQGIENLNHQRDDAKAADSARVQLFNSTQQLDDVLDNKEGA